MDTREQAGLDFPAHPWLDAVERATLPVGDYQVRFKDGTIPPVSFERKSLNDLFGTMTGGYRRFKAEVRRARDLGTHLLVITEAPLGSVYHGTQHSAFPGPSLTQKLFTLMVRHRLPVVFCRNREEMARYILEYFLACGREYSLERRQRVR